MVIGISFERLTLPSPSFFRELQELEEKGLPNVYDRIFVSDRVHIDLDLHAAVDGLEEAELGGSYLHFSPHPRPNRHD